MVLEQHKSWTTTDLPKLQQSQHVNDNFWGTRIQAIGSVCFLFIERQISYLYTSYYICL
jgi:hypothetical protein